MKTLYILLIVLISSSTAFAMEKGPRLGRAIYSCDLSAAEVIADMTSQVLSEDPDATVSFKVGATLIKNNKLLVKNTDGLPGPKIPSVGARLTTTIMIPFTTADFRESGTFDSIAFNSHVSEQLNRDGMQVPAGATGINCGGSPTDTVITEHFDSCLLGNVTTKYIGSLSVDGEYYWSITSSGLGAAKVGCYGILGQALVQ